MTAPQGAAGTARSARIAADLARFAAMTQDGSGITRLAYSPLEREAHRVFAATMGEMGCQVHVDRAGNTIAELPGTEPGLPALGTGSHLDSVYSGGRFDGAAGVVAGIELVRLVHDGGVPFRHPIRVVAFAAEEGARFGLACIGSKLATGLTSVQELHSRRDRDGVSIADAMTAVGLDPQDAVDTPWRGQEWAAFVELHIEQGTVLESHDTTIGLVDLISGSTRLEFQVTGVASHTGGTPMQHRSDALTAAAEIVLTAERTANDSRHRGTRATVGRLEVAPNSITTIPGSVVFSLDVRDVDADRQRSTAAAIAAEAERVCRARKVSLAVRTIGDTSPVVLPVWLRALASAAARDVGLNYRVLTSGASHDTQMVNRIVPGAMIFVPSRDGLSHVPEEWTSAEDLAKGTDVLLATLRRLDGR